MIGITELWNIVEEFIDSEEKKMFRCELIEHKLKDCVNKNLLVEGGDFIPFSSEVDSKKLTETFLNCLSSSLLLCLENHGIDLDLLKSKAEIFAEKNRRGTWEIQEVILTLYPKTKEKMVLEKINQCLTFFKHTCNVKNRQGKNIKINVFLAP